MRGRRLVLALAALAGALACAEASYRLLLWGRRAASGRSAAFEIFAFGSSVATGGLHPSELAFAPIAGRMFEGRIGGRPIFVDIVSAPGSSFYSDYLALRRRLAFRDKGQPGVALIYASADRAQNEPRRFRACFVLLEALKRRALLRSYFLSDLLYQLERSLRLRGVRDRGFYEFYLRRIIEECRAAGVTPILATATFNLAGVEPDLDFQGPASDARLLEPGLRLEGRGDFRPAIAYYRSLAAGQPLIRLLRFRIARCHQAMGRYDEAREDYWRAVDEGSPFPFRDVNRLIKALGAEYGVPVVDAVALFTARAPHGLIGAESFTDWGHPNTMGQIALARAFAKEISALSGEKVRRDFRGPAELYEDVPYPPKLQACGLVADGLWILKSSIRYPHAELRLGAAERSFREATRLTPDNAAAQVGLALTESAESRGFVLQDFDLAWFVSSRSGHSVCFEPGLSDEDWDRLLPEVRRNLAALRNSGALSATGPRASVAPYRGF